MAVRCGRGGSSIALTLFPRLPRTESTSRAGSTTRDMVAAPAIYAGRAHVPHRHVPTTADERPVPASRMRPGLVALFAVACGVSAANLYYAQPLLPQVSRALHASSGATALVITAAQVGYGIGLALIVPLGDILIRRRMVPRILLIAAAALLVASAAPNLTVLIAAVAIAGLCSVAAQILVPFAASLASDQERGRVVGTVMSGLLLGILLARTFSGLIAEVAGWRVVYVTAGGVVVVLAALLDRRLPGEQSRPSIRYAELLGSVVHLMRTEPLLRLRAAIGGLVFATFNVIWTSLAFLLVASPYHYSEAVIGLFGLLGAAGAPGRLVQRAAGRPRAGTMGHRGVTGHHRRLDRPPGPRRPPAVGPDGRHPPRRHGDPVRAHPEPAPDLRHRPGRPVPAQYRLHGDLLLRRGHRLGHHRAGLRRRRLVGRHHPGRLLSVACLVLWVVSLAVPGLRSVQTDGTAPGRFAPPDRPEQARLVAMSKLSRVDRLIGAALVALLVSLLAWALVHHSGTTHPAVARATRPTAAPGHHPAPASSTTATSTTRPIPAPSTASTLPNQSAPTTAPSVDPAHGPVASAMPVSGTVTAVGDSIMLDIQPYLEQDIPGVGVDGVVSRQFETGIGVVQADAAAGTLGSIVVIELGTNGTVTDAEFDEMMQAAAGAERVVFVNVDVPRSWEAPDNAVLAAGVARYPGVAVLADWYSLSVGHPEWFTPDQVHLEPAGAQALAALITANA